MHGLHPTNTGPVFKKNAPVNQLFSLAISKVMNVLIACSAPFVQTCSVSCRTARSKSCDPRSVELCPGRTSNLAGEDSFGPAPRAAFMKYPSSGPKLKEWRRRKDRLSGCGVDSLPLTPNTATYIYRVQVISDFEESDDCRRKFTPGLCWGASEIIFAESQINSQSSQETVFWPEAKRNRKASSLTSTAVMRFGSSMPGS